MSVFNPDVPNSAAPNFFKYSDSITQPKADESRGIALKTLGTGLEGTAEIADTVVKGVIKSDVYDRVDSERTKFTTALSNAVTFGNASGPQAPNGQDPANTVVEGTPGPPVDIMAGQNTSVPNAVSRGIGKVGFNETALEQGKITETQYHQNLNTIAKDLRMTYPGYRDYIDTQISHITGVNPANALVSDYISTINSAMSQQQTEKNYWRNKIIDSGFPDNDKVLAQFEKDGNHARVSQYLAYNNGIRSNLALKQAVFQDTTNDKATRVSAGEDFANYAANTAATTHFYNSQKFTNGDMSASDIADKMADLSLHPEKANDVAYQGLAERYAALHTQSYNQTMRLLTTPQKRPDGTFAPPVSDTIGMDKTKAIVDKSVGALFDKTREFITDKQFSPAYSMQNAAAALTNNNLWKVQNDPTMSNVIGTYTSLNKLMPNFIPLLQGKAIANGLDKDLGDLVDHQTKMGVAQPPQAGKYYGADGQLYSFKQALEEQEQASKITGKPLPGEAPKALLNARLAIIDPQATPESIHNTVRFFYDPQVNKGVMKKFMDDYYDPSKAGMVRGRTSAFVDLTDDKVTSSIWTKGSKDDWNKYSTWAKGEFAEQFGSSVRELNGYVNPDTGITAGATHKIEGKLTWNAESKQLKLENIEVGGSNGDINRGVSTKVDNLNRGLRSIANIAKTEGTNVDAYLFKVLKDNGFSPTKDVEGIPAQVMRALIVGNGGKIKENGPKNNFAPEDIGGDLRGFLTNPTGRNPSSTAPVLEPYQTRNVIKGNLSDLPPEAPIRVNR